jgi:cyclophilin family peptidyl-prolyl cis-trans isomerase
MPPADKRARKKENARAAREQREAALQRRKRMRTGRNVGIVVALFVGVIVLLNVAGSGSKKAATTTTTTGLPVGCVTTTPPKSPKPILSKPAMTIDPTKTYTATFSTSCGTFTAKLDAKSAPKGVNNFVFLAKRHFYDGLAWSRVAKDFVIQSGDPSGTGDGNPGYSLLTETPRNGYPLGTLAWAKKQPDPRGTAGSQFFVVTGTGPSSAALSQPVNGALQYGAFGKVTSGLGNAQKIMSLAPASGDGPPAKPMYIFKVTIKES